MKQPAFLTLAIGIIAGGFFCTQAFGQAPITGKINFVGSVAYDTNSLATATEVMTWYPANYPTSPSGNSTVTNPITGSFATYIMAGDLAAMASPWKFNPSTMTPNLWSVTDNGETFTFTLTSSTIVTQTANNLNILGTGMVSGSGATNFQTTPATWSFGSTNSDGQPQDTFSFSAESSAVPEASSSILLGIGSIGLALMALRRKRKSLLMP